MNGNSALLARWHLWIGGLVALPLLLVALSGATLVFRKEIQDYWESDLRCVTPGESRQPLSRQIASLREAHPGWTPITITLSHRRDRSTLVQVQKPIPVVGSIPYVAIDPYTAAILGEGDLNSDFFNSVLLLHRTLLIGSEGRLLVEMVASLAIVAVCTGGLLWRPPRFVRSRSIPKNPAKRVSLQPLLLAAHSHAGLLVAVPALAICLSGLIFTSLWGAWANYLTKGLISFPHELLVQPLSNPRGATSFGMESGVTLDQIERQADGWFPGETIRISLPISPEASYCIHAMSDDGTLVKGLACIDQYDGSLLHIARGNELEWWKSLRLAALSIHTGSIGGVATKWVAFLACILLAGLAVTGPWMWLTRVRRQPGTPKLTAAVHQGADSVRGLRPLAMIFFGLLIGIALPMVGLFALLVLIPQWVIGWMRRG
jgi:uncharacterized iron-regulated membrane protein